MVTQLPEVDERRCLAAAEPLPNTINISRFMLTSMMPVFVKCISLFYQLGTHAAYEVMT